MAQAAVTAIASTEPPGPGAVVPFGRGQRGRSLALQKVPMETRGLRHRVTP